MKPLLLFLSLAAVGLAQTPPPHSAFYRDEVYEIRLTFAQSDWWEQLTKNYAENEDNVPYIEASLEWGQWKFARVGARFKGNSSYMGATTKKKPFRIKLNEFVKGQKIEGMASFNLSNGWNDPSMVRERVYWDLVTAAGFLGPRSNFAALYVNGQYWGLYALGEIVNGDFLENWLGKKNSAGNLYKARMGGALEDKGDDPAAYKTMFEKQSNEEADDWSDIAQLAAILNRTAIEELPAKLEPILDVDSVLCALALDNLTVNLDSYVGMAQNYYLYRRPSDNKFVWILWDPSLAFGGLGQGLSVDEMKKLSLEWTTASMTQTFSGGLPPGVDPGQLPPGVPFPTAPGGGGFGGAMGGSSTARPLATRLWEVPQYKERYTQIYRWLATEIFLPDQILTRTRVLRDMIRPWMEKDTQKLCTMQEFEDALSKDIQLATMGGGGVAPGGGPGPGGPGPGGTPPGGTPPGGTPPTDLAGRSMGNTVPGLDAFVRDRADFVKAQLSQQ